MKKPLLSIVSIVVLALCTSCSSLLYFPTHVVHYDPKQLGLVPEDIEIEVAPQIKVHGWYFKSRIEKSGPKKPKGVLVFFHGNAENLTSHYVTLSWILKEGYDYFIWDYRGYGKSQGKPNPQNTVEDGKAVIKYIYDKNPKIPLYVFAQSLGGAIGMRSVIDLKGEIPIKALIVDSTFESYESVASDVLSHHFITWLFQPLAYLVLSDKYSPKGKVSEVSPIPLLVMHGTKDTVVSYKFGEQIFQDAKDPKEFWTIENGTHIDSFWGAHAEIYRKKFLTYLKKYN